jgi:hypothetical protein
MRATLTDTAGPATAPASRHTRHHAWHHNAWRVLRVQIAPMKALPTDEEIAEAGQADAGMYLQWLAETDEAAYENLLEERATPWGAESADQPIDRCVAHVISIIIRTIEADSSGSDDCNLTQHEINDWLQYALKSKGKG